MDNHQTSEKETSPWKSRIKATGLVVIGVLLGLNLSGFYFNEQETVVALPVSSQLEMNGLPDYSSNFKALDPLVMVIEGETGWGSGFLYTDGGYVITNAHVVTDGLDVTVWNSFSHPSDGTVVGISEFMDIALIHVPDYEGNEGVPINRELNVQPGIPILTISTPYDNQNTGAVGYITGRKRSVEMESASNYNQFIQFDGQVGPGSSGGPLFDRSTGEVIGIITQTGGDFGEIKYAIPVEDALYFVDRWLKKPMQAKTIEEVQSNLKQLYEWE